MCPKFQITFRSEKQSFSQNFEGQLASHGDDEGVVGDLENGPVHDPMVRPLEHHGDGCQGRDQDHDPLQIGDESQELVHRLEPDLPLLPGHRVFQAAVIMSADDGLANSPEKLFENYQFV